MTDDTISRTAALKGLEDLNIASFYELNEHSKEAYTEVKTMLKALPSAQPGCEDAVSRFEVLRLIDYSSHDLNDAVDNRYMQNEIKQLPSVTPKQPGWIPWDSGRFPEESGTYTVTAYDGATKRVTYAKYQKRLKRWELTGARAYWRVLAWMEKPEPWRGGQDGEG